MNLNIKKTQGTIIVYLHGRLEAHHVDEIEKDIIRIIDAEPSMHLILNLQDIDYVSSSGIGLFVTVMNILKQRGKMFGICALNSPVKRIMEIVEISTLLHIFKDETGAVEFLTGSTSQN